MRTPAEGRRRRWWPGKEGTKNLVAELWGEGGANVSRIALLKIFYVAQDSLLALLPTLPFTTLFVLAVSG